MEEHETAPPISPGHASPPSLQSLCVDAFCRDPTSICLPVTAGCTDTPYPDAYPPRFTVLRFPFSDAYLHQELAERLLRELGRRRQLTDEVMTLFDTRCTHLRTVALLHARRLTPAGLRSLRGHKIAELSADGLAPATVTDLVGCLGDWTVRNLRSLDVTRCTFVDGGKHAVTVSLSKLKALRRLNVAWTEFNQAGLEMVADDLPLLEHVDVSCSKVSDVSPLRKCRGRLKSLSMYNLDLSHGEALTEMLAQLSNLTHLDISCDVPPDHLSTLQGADQATKFRVNEFLQRTAILPHLAHLDISGISPPSFPVRN